MILAFEILGGICLVMAVIVVLERFAKNKKRD